MDGCGVEPGNPVVFDRTEGRRWEEKLFRREERTDDGTVTVQGM